MICGCVQVAPPSVDFTKASCWLLRVPCFGVLGDTIRLAKSKSVCGVVDVSTTTMLPIVCWRCFVLMMICAWLHVLPPSTVLEKYAGPVYDAVCGLSSGLSVGSISVSHTVYAVPGVAGSAVVEFLSVLWANCVNAEPGISPTLSHFAPKFVDVATTTELAQLGTRMLKASADA